MRVFTFEVAFKDGQKVTIKDVNNFSEAQLNEIQAVAGEWEQTRLKAQKYGIEIKTIEPTHKMNVLSLKSNIVSQFSTTELYKQKIIMVTFHSIERILKRVGSNDESTYISLIEKIKRANSIIKAQWKGYPQLSYTFVETEDPEQYVLPLSFLLKRSGRHNIRLITVVNEDEDREPEEMKNRLIENPQLADSFKKMEQLFKKS